MAAEELPAGVVLHEVPWYGQLADKAHALAKDLVGQTPLSESAVATELRAARQPLLPGESTRYANLGRDVAGAMTEVLSGARPGDTEFQLAAALAARAVAAGAEPVVLLCNGSTRGSFRHPLPTAYTDRPQGDARRLRQARRNGGQRDPLGPFRCLDAVGAQRRIQDRSRRGRHP